jgi:hypothetical protein
MRVDCFASTIYSLGQFRSWTADINERQNNEPLTAPCQKRGESGNLKFCAFNYLCAGRQFCTPKSPPSASCKPLAVSVERHRKY